MGYDGVNLKSSISIGKIYSIHYFEYMSDFSFGGEIHNFWEFICVDKGEIGITADKTFTILKAGDIAFHQPNEFHNVQATGGIASNLVVISFDCHNPAINFFRKQVLKIDDLERNLLANIIIEAKHCFDCRLDDPYLMNMPLKEPLIFGAEQMILNYLEHFLIHIIRRYSAPAAPVLNTPVKVGTLKSNNETFSRIIDYLESNKCSHLTIEQICHDNLIGRSQLQKLFKKQCGMGIIEYFSSIKINAAKEMIRTKQMNFTQISEQLGYTSIHYFSRRFKIETGMTPSEYASSIKAMADGNF
ncbi:MAG: helix-turn-helix transcriptional regulator [Dorea sp.]|jgi:AraC-like DNA-binding protein|nr:helix-turn-helix transcriptional regulator [Dorea sp.]